MELAAAKLEDDRLKKIATDPFIDRPLAVAQLLCHVKWLNDELERVAEERDSLRDSRDAGALASQLKRARAILGDIILVLDLPCGHDPVTAVRTLKAECEQLRSRTAEPPRPDNLTLDQIHHLLQFLKNAAHVYYMSNGGKIGG